MRGRKCCWCGGPFLWGYNCVDLFTSQVIHHRNTKELFHILQPCLFVGVLVCLYVFVRWCVLSVCLLVCLSVCCLVCLSVCCLVCLFVGVCLSVVCWCLVCLFVCLSVCLLVCLSLLFGMSVCVHTALLVDITTTHSFTI